VISIGKFLKHSFFAALLLVAAGCGGISASKSVSPLDFFLPGLLQADPPRTPQTLPDREFPDQTPVTLVAQN
jgi:hypothetical protein